MFEAPAGQPDFAERKAETMNGKSANNGLKNPVSSGAKAATHRAGQARRQKADEHVVAVPAELKRSFAGNRSLLRWYEQLNYSTRKEIAAWITDVKSAEARVRRAEQIAERLLATMEAEHELPPAMQVAFARNPRARAGWEQMSQARRRMHLLSIFYYRDPEGRARRVAQAVQDADRVAVRKAAKSLGG